jgi:predicted nucleic acid-binding protein
MMELTMNTIRKSWKIKLRYHFSIYDSLIVASALEAGCTILYSEDLQHNQFIENKVRVVNPFAI